MTARFNALLPNKNRLLRKKNIFLVKLLCSKKNEKILPQQTIQCSKSVIQIAHENDKIPQNHNPNEEPNTVRIELEQKVISWRL